MNCDKCGAFFDDEALVECPECGATLNQEQELPNETTTEQNIGDLEAIAHEDEDSNELAICDSDGATEEEFEEVLNDEAERQNKLDAIQARRDAKLRKRQHGRVAGAIFLAIVIVAIAGGGLYFLAQHSGMFKDGRNVISASGSPSPNQENDKGILSAAADLSGRTIKAIKVIVSDDDKYYIEFTLDDKHYLARINYGTTDEQIKDNLYIVDAHADEEYQCDGCVAYVLDTIVRGKTANEYILPKSSTELLTKADIQGLEARELYVARNEIYARHGMKFNEERLNSYFTSKTWYKPVDDFNDSVLSSTELKNAELILEKEKALEGKTDK